jgi:hypothetical protein
MDVSAVAALYNKSLDLEHNGHTARSDEYLARALAAAQALGAEDCLIVASLQLNQADALFCAAFDTTARGTPATAQLVASMVPPYLAAVATLQRRSAAGTLLAGTCRPAEEEWDRLKCGHLARLRAEGCTDAIAATFAPLVGYKAFLIAACFAAHLVSATRTCVLPMSSAQLHECVALMADAV